MSVNWFQLMAVTSAALFGGLLRKHMKTCYMTHRSMYMSFLAYFSRHQCLIRSGNARVRLKSCAFICRRTGYKFPTKLPDADRFCRLSVPSFGDFERHCSGEDHLQSPMLPSCALNTNECERRWRVAGRGAKSPRNFLNVLAKCSNPQYIYRVALRAAGGCARVRARVRICACVRGASRYFHSTHRVIAPYDRECYTFAEVG